LQRSIDRKLTNLFKLTEDLVWRMPANWTRTTLLHRSTGYYTIGVTEKSLIWNSWSKLT